MRRYRLVTPVCYCCFRGLVILSIPQRAAIVCGTYEPTKEEIPEDTETEKKALAEVTAQSAPAGGGEYREKGSVGYALIRIFFLLHFIDIKGIPGFWLKAIKNY